MINKTNPQIQTSLSTMKEAAVELAKKTGWKPGDRFSFHSTTELMAALAMQVYRGEIGCDYPNCGCCADGACGDAVEQHPDLGGAPAPQTHVDLREAAWSLVKDLNRSLVGSRDIAVIHATNTSVKRLRILLEKLDRDTPSPQSNTAGPECQYSKDVAMPEHRCAVRCQYGIAADDLVKAERDRCLDIVDRYYGGGRSFVMRKIAPIAATATEGSDNG